jgi:WD40 repeat protein
MIAIARYIIFICILSAASYAAANYDLSSLLKTKAKEAKGPGSHKTGMFTQLADKPSVILSGLAAPAVLDYAPAKALTAAAAENMITVWRLPDPDPIMEINAGDGFDIMSIKFLPGSDLLAAGGKSAGDTGSVRLFNAVTGELIQEIDEPEPVSFLDPHTDGRHIIATGETYIKVLDLKDANTVIIVKKNTPDAKGYYYGSGQYLLQSDTLSLFDLKTRAVPGVLDNKSTPTVFRESIDGKTFAWLSDNGLTLADTATGKKQLYLMPTRNVTAFSVHPDAGWGMFLAEEQKVAVMDLTSGRQIKSISLTSPVSDIAFNPDGNSVYLLYASGDIEVYDIGYRNALKNIRFTLARKMQILKDKLAKAPAAQPGQ